MNELHMWGYWRDKCCDAYDAVEGYYPELLQGTDERCRDLQVAMATIRNARRVLQAAIRKTPHFPGPVAQTATDTIQLNQKVIELIMADLAENGPEED